MQANTAPRIFERTSLYKPCLQSTNHLSQPNQPTPKPQLITSYEGLRAEPLKSVLLGVPSWGAVVLDEGQRIRNAEADVSQVREAP